jgi:hypothetical protein
MRAAIIGFTVVLLVPTCVGQSVTPGDLIGRWDLTARVDSGAVSRPTLRLMLFITTLRRDSVFGEATVYLDRNQPLDNRRCARLAGTLSDSSHVNLIIFTTDEPAADMILDAQLDGARLLGGSFRPRDGNNVLPPGARLVFARQSKDPRRVGCLTSA